MEIKIVITDYQNKRMQCTIDGDVNDIAKLFEEKPLFAESKRAEITFGDTERTHFYVLDGVKCTHGGFFKSKTSPGIGLFGIPDVIYEPPFVESGRAIPLYGMIEVPHPNYVYPEFLSNTMDSD